MKMNRRTFLSRATSGVGAIALGGAAASLPTTAAPARTSPSAGKRLVATTDYVDNMLECGCHYDRAKLDGLHRYLASIGVTRHQWIVDTIWNVYERNPPGIDLLAEAVASAHAHGLEFYAQLKPFEGGGFGEPLPLTFPFPPGVIALRDIRGIFPHARPFVAAHPEMCLQRRPGGAGWHGPPVTIRLVKANQQTTRIRPEHLSLWTSSTNNRFARYEGPVSFRETVEWRPTFPGGRQCRILHLTGLQLPTAHRYILLRCALADDEGDFTNEGGNLVELEGRDGGALPFILGSGPADLRQARARWDLPANALRRQLLRYHNLPEVRAITEDPSRWEEHFRDYCVFGNQSLTGTYTLDKAGHVAMACGKPEYMLGNLHPIYPEVRRHWLDLIRYCLERGVDGINIRQAHHTRSTEPWEYGFNAPVLAATGGRTDYPSITRANGDAYTQFLREAHDVLKSHGKPLTLHLHAQMLAPDDRGYLSYLPPNFDWQWETWANEIADELELRKHWTLRPWNIRPMVERFLAVTRAANKPLYLQSRFRELSYAGPNRRLREELELYRSHPDLSGFVLYETAYCTRVNASGEVEGSPDVAQLMKTIFFGPPQR